MKISVFGLGYVGAVTAACFAQEKHEVLGVDVMDEKVRLLNEGQSPIIEEQIGDIIAEQVRCSRLRATTDCAEGLAQADIAIVCVGTPSQADGALDTSYVAKVCTQIGEALANRSKELLIVIRSTVVPGTTLQLALPAIEKASGKKHGDGYRVVFHPEFLREGSSVYDFFNPPKIVIGELEEGDSRKLLELYPEDRFNCKRIICPLETAETVKYCDNLFHAIKITFANEVGQLCNALGIDSAKVMEIFCEDKKLNISAKYLRPGFAFGGSCLPKDLRAFLSMAKTHHLELPFLGSVLKSNDSQVERAMQIALKYQIRDIGLYGLAFKPGTDDLRESPLVELAERLLGKGMRLKIYDENVRIARLVGKNKSFIEARLPHLAELLIEDIGELESRPLILLGHPMQAEQVQLLLEAGKQVVDLSGFTPRADSPAFASIN